MTTTATTTATTTPIQPRHGLITLTAGYTPTTHVHHPDSLYVRTFWTPLLGIGPTATWDRLTEHLPLNDHATNELPYDELAHSLGLSPARFTKTLRRLINFHLINHHPDTPHTLGVLRRAPSLHDTQIARLTERCPTIAATHPRHTTRN